MSIDEIINLKNPFLLHVIYYALQKIRHRHWNANIQEGLLLNECLARPLPGARDKAIDVISSLEKDTGSSIDKWSEQDVEKNTKILGDILESKVIKTPSNKKKDGKKLLQLLRDINENKSENPTATREELSGKLAKISELENEHKISTMQFYTKDNSVITTSDSAEYFLEVLNKMVSTLESSSDFHEPGYQPPNF